MAVRLWVLACACVVASAGFCGDSDTEALRNELHAMRQAYEGRISALEGELNQLKTKGVVQQKSSNEKIEDSLKRAGPNFTSTRPPLQFENAVRSSVRLNLGGYFEFNYIDRGDRIGEFNQAKAVIELGGQITERIKFYSEFEFENGATIEPGEDTGGEWELEQAYLDYEINKALVFRSGVFLVPLGRFNLNHEGFVNNFVERPLMSTYVSPTTFYEEGVGFHGTPMDNSKLGISYEAYIMNPTHTDEIDSQNGFFEIRNEGKAPVSDNKAGAARVTFEPARSLKRIADFFEIGFSAYYSGFRGYQGPDEDGNPVNYNGGALHILSSDLTWERKGVGFRGEVASSHVDAGKNQNRPHQDAFGYYLEAYYKFWPKFLNSSPFGKDFKDPKLIAAVRFDYIDTNVQSLDRGDLNRVSIDMSYRPVQNVAFKLEYQIDHSPSRAAGTELERTGDGRNTDALLFGVHYGF